MELGMNVWEISAPSDKAAFLRLLPTLFSADCELILESTRFAPEVRDFLKSNGHDSRSANHRKIFRRRPDRFALPISVSRLEQLAGLTEKYSVQKVCDHLHVYRGDEQLLQWHDVFCDDEWYLPSALPEETIQRIGQTLGCTFQRLDLDLPTK